MGANAGLITTVRTAVDEHAPDIDELRDRAEVLRDRAGDFRDRAGDAPDAVRQGLRDLQPQARRAAVSLLEAFQALLRVGVALPRLALRVLGLLRTAAVHVDDARDRGAVLAERARDAARSIPPSRRGRWRNRARTTGLLGAGFAVGLLVGWFLGQRRDGATRPDTPVVLQSVSEDAESAGEQSAEDPTGAESNREAGLEDGPDSGTGT